MPKKLSEMTLEEQWQLFPIILTEHQDRWDEWYEEERRLLASLLPGDVVISHIGSTAIRGIMAKPIVDILVEIPPDMDMAGTGEYLASCGYILMNKNGMRADLNKGYTENGFAEKVFHVHVKYMGDRDEVLFRDYMNAHPDAAKEYEQLKLSLWKRYEHDRDGYTEAKTEFVKRYTEIARNETGGMEKNNTE